MLSSTKSFAKVATQPLHCVVVSLSGLRAEAEKWKRRVFILIAVYREQPRKIVITSY